MREFMDFLLLTFYFFPLLVSDVNVSNIFNSSEAVFYPLLLTNSMQELDLQSFTGIFADFLA